MRTGADPRSARPGRVCRPAVAADDDLWVGGLAEDHAPGGSLGPLFQRIVLDQFQRARGGDRLWFENQYSGSALAALENTTLAGILRRNTVNDNLQANVFFFKMEVSGTVFNYANRNGVRDAGEAGVAGRFVQLIDHETGDVVAQTTTGSDRTYRFDNLAFGLEPATGYDVREVLPNGVFQTTANPRTVTFTRGQRFGGVNFGNANRPALTASAAGMLANPLATDTGSAVSPLDDAALANLTGAIVS